MTLRTFYLYLTIMISISNIANAGDGCCNLSQDSNIDCGWVTPTEYCAYTHIRGNNPQYYIYTGKENCILGDTVKAVDKCQASPQAHCRPPCEGSLKKLQNLSEKKPTSKANRN